MKKKHLFLVGGFLAACICLPLGVVAIIPPGPGVTKANFDRIEIGMTKAQVEKIFGGEGELGADGCTWHADDGSFAFVWFIDDRVLRVQWLSSHDTFFDKIRRWLHLS